MDADDNLWVAFWEGSAIRCFDGRSGKLIEQIDLPARRITSGAFAGANLDQLIITSAREDSEVGESPEAGMTFISAPGVRGKVTNTFTFLAADA
jgi:gluconolactonase